VDTAGTGASATYVYDCRSLTYVQVSSLFYEVSATSRRTLTTCLHLVAYSNCAINPLVYCLLNDRFKTTLRTLVAAAKSSCRRPHSVHGQLSAAQPLRIALLLSSNVAMTTNSAPTRPGMTCMHAEPGGHRR